MSVSSSTCKSETTIRGKADAARRQGDFALSLQLYEKLAALGSKTAYYDAGQILALGLGSVQAQPEKAIKYLEKALTSSAPCLRELTACKLYDIYYWGLTNMPKDCEKAAAYVKSYEHVEHPNLAEARCMFRLGVCYEYGFGIKKNVTKAMRLYRQASAAGYVTARINLWRRRFYKGNPLAFFPWQIATRHFQYLKIAARLKKRDDYRVK